MDLVYLMLLPFAGSLVAALMPTHARTAAAAWAALVAAAALVWVALLFPTLQAGTVLREEYRWIPSAGINFAVRMDGFAWMFAMLVTGIGTLVALYARYYMSKNDPVPRFFSFFLAFMGAMLGVVLSGNVVQLAFFWELTSLFSFLLIGYWHHRRDARRGARMALTVTGAGGLAMLAGMLMLGHIAGSYQLDVILGAGERIRAHPLYTPMLLLVLLGALTKSAQFPFQFWLPRAMAAPTPVSAYLHSATMVKAGVFLLARLWPALSGTEQWFWLVGGAGVITLVLGAYVAMFQTDLKGLLAYSTISHLGLITLLLGLNRDLAAVAAVFHIMNHATFKASLFMAAGIIDHETGTRDIRRLSGLWKAMPITGTLAFVASAAMAGVPLMNGFLSKEMFFAETIDLSARPWLDVGLPIAATVAGIFAVVYSLRFSIDVFLGPPARDLPLAPHEPVRWMRVPIEVLVLLCIVVGMFPQWSIGPALDVAARPVVGGPMPRFSLAIWHGFNKPLVMSLIALTGGIALFMLLRGGLESGRIRRVPLLHRLDGQRLFQSALYGLDRASRWALAALSTHRLQPQMLLMVAVAIAVATAALWPGGVGWGPRARTPGSLEFALLWVFGGVAAIATANQAKFHRLVALVALGAVGLVVSLTFLWFSAPDLALTQLTVEVVTTVLFLLGLRWLPKRLPHEPGRLGLRVRLRRARDLTVSVAAGTGMAVLAYAMMTRPAPQSISPFFIDRALPEGGGTNVVNVMLVDFRAFDTLGEITVLGIVGLTVYALLRRFRPPRETAVLPPQQRAVPPDLVSDLINPRTAQDTALGYAMVPAVLVRLLLPVAAVIAMYFFMRGHNLPGGGFVAGLVVAIAFLTQYIVAGTRWVEAHLQLKVIRWIAWGLLIAVATGLGSLGFGYPFLTSHTAHLTLPVIGEIHLASAMFFDLGVFAVVVGATLLILTALAHQSVRGHRRAPEKTVTASTGPREID
ncbi:monovalent cation/H+ antiporter subunit A [Ottowia testudinis]|uniref:Monovalent cation/H+ antiporter subunit A n=1 Tax=Ottowia testudinis TaxID=2816950 RepID=A0A975CIF8_9BURK|nr:monovalent cation/H+ antiporter subunit A [Ottowia testudinis]QTD46780.1 monovalent cation/H+ antiporter subunit A [Ottowia testudinis]